MWFLCQPASGQANRTYTVIKITQIQFIRTHQGLQKRKNPCSGQRLESAKTHFRVQNLRAGEFGRRWETKDGQTIVSRLPWVAQLPNREVFDEIHRVSLPWEIDLQKVWRSFAQALTVLRVCNRTLFLHRADSMALRTELPPAKAHRNQRFYYIEACLRGFELL